MALHFSFKNLSSYDIFFIELSYFKISITNVYINTVHMYRIHIDLINTLDFQI